MIDDELKRISNFLRADPRTNVELAALTGVSEATIRSVRNGNYFLSVRTLRALEKIACEPNDLRPSSTDEAA